ncbi:MAG: GtrA family protein [Lachnospiraceae bacterium]|nr:GtrA family protein [Lachnospiraceae bacterium]
MIEVLSFTLLDTFTSWHYWPKYLIALVLSVLWNFTLNRKFTFQSANNVPKAMMLVALFYLVFTPTTTILGNYLAEDLHWNEYLVTGINMALNLSTEYLYDRFVLFRNRIDTNERAKKQTEMQ